MANTGDRTRYETTFIEETARTCRPITTGNCWNNSGFVHSTTIEHPVTCTRAYICVYNDKTNRNDRDVVSHYVPFSFSLPVVACPTHCYPDHPFEYYFFFFLIPFYLIGQSRDTYFRGRCLTSRFQFLFPFHPFYTQCQVHERRWKHGPPFSIDISFVR